MDSASSGTRRDRWKSDMCRILNPSRSSGRSGTVTERVTTRYCLAFLTPRLKKPKVLSKLRRKHTAKPNAQPAGCVSFLSFPLRRYFASAFVLTVIRSLARVARGGRANKRDVNSWDSRGDVVGAKPHSVWAVSISKLIPSCFRNRLIPQEGLPHNTRSQIAGIVTDKRYTGVNELYRIQIQDSRSRRKCVWSRKQS